VGDVSKLNTPEAIAKRGLTQRANSSVKHALMNAFDKLGNEAFFIELGRGSAEDKRCLAMILAKLIPIEVAGALDATLTVRVVTQMGADVIDVTHAQSLPKEPARQVTVEPPGRVPEEDHADA
jgi:hypothetical protein